jgi:hypothetical protein
VAKTTRSLPRASSAPPLPEWDSVVAVIFADGVQAGIHCTLVLETRDRATSPQSPSRSDNPSAWMFRMSLSHHTANGMVDGPTAHPSARLTSSMCSRKVAGRNIARLRRCRVAAAFVSIAVVACGGDRPQARDTVRDIVRDTVGASGSDLRPGSPPPPVGSAAATSLPDISAHPVSWDGAGVAERLRSLGLRVVVRPPSGDAASIRAVPSNGHVADLTVRSSRSDSADVAVYIFGGPIVAGRRALELRATPGRTDHRIDSTATSELILTNNNMVAVIRNGTPGLRESIRSAFATSDSTGRRD